MVVSREFKGKFVCLAYGICCIKYQPLINEPELTAISNYLGIEPEVFILNYTDHRWPGTTNFLINHNENGCIFLKARKGSEQKLCSIHEVKPKCCRDWKEDIIKSECRECLQQIYKLTAVDHDIIIGNTLDIDKFLEYIEHPSY